MKDDLEKIQFGIVNDKPNDVLFNSSNMARRAHRVLTSAKREIENSEDPDYIATGTVLNFSKFFFDKILDFEFFIF